MFFIYLKFPFFLIAPSVEEIAAAEMEAREGLAAAKFAMELQIEEDID